jgi:hypothetical protein
MVGGAQHPAVNSELAIRRTVAQRSVGKFLGPFPTMEKVRIFFNRVLIFALPPNGSSQLMGEFVVERFHKSNINSSFSAGLCG